MLTPLLHAASGQRPRTFRSVSNGASPPAVCQLFPMDLLVTGSSGLIGSEVCVHFAEKGWTIHGVDNLGKKVEC